MNIRITRQLAVMISLLLVVGTISMSFVTVDSYAGELTEKGKKAGEKAKDSANKGKDAVKDVASKGKDAVAKGGKATADQLKKWKAKIDKKEFKKGWEKAADFAASDYAAQQGIKYINNVASAIETFRLDVNMAKGSARGVAQEAGYVAEKWHVNTFNIDAAVKGRSSKATTPGSNEFASPDIDTNYGEKASLKYYKSGSESARAQAKSIIKRYNEYCAESSNPKDLSEYLDERGISNEDKAVYESVYSGQTRIIPSDQMKEATDFINGKIDKYSSMEGKVPEASAKTYGETLEKLRDRIQDPKGTQSKPATYEEMQAVAELAKEGKFDPEQFGFSVSQIITPKYIVKQAVNTGGKTAAVKVAIDLGPNIYAIIVKGIETGEIDKSDFKELGIDGLESGAEGFIEGSVSCAILTACQAGQFGPALTNASPDVVGALTVLAIDSVRYGYALSKGDITPMQFGDLMAEDVVVSSGALAAGAGLSMLFGGSVIVCMAGCLAGGMLASMGYSYGKQTALEVRDAGGFAAVVPIDSVKGTLLNKKAIASLKMKDVATNIKGMTISTMKDGKIAISMNQKKDNKGGGVQIIN